MKTFFPAVVFAAVATPVLAGVYGDVPDASHAWAVHDRNRPNPVKISAEPGQAPGDAVVLFDGSAASFANWCAMDGKPTKWNFKDGALESVKKAGYIRSKREFGGDFQLHVEWAAPVKVEGVGQGRGNSGVFMFNDYEVQVLDSWETDPSKTPNPNPNYADGQAAAVYGQNPPLVNASRAPGQWQTYDIVFHAPKWENGAEKWPGTVTVFHNGVLVQDNWEYEGITGHQARFGKKQPPAKAPIAFQDHGNPVRFRNVWIREIPARQANVVHGGPYVCKDAVMKLRREIAASLWKKIADPAKSDAANLHALLEVCSYAKEEPYAGALRAAVGAYVARMQTLDAAGEDKMKGEFEGLKRAFQTARKGGVVSDRCRLLAALDALWAKRGWNKK